MDNKKKKKKIELLKYDLYLLKNEIIKNKVGILYCVFFLLKNEKLLNIKLDCWII